MKFAILFAAIFVLTSGDIVPDANHNLEENNENLTLKVEDLEDDNNFRNERIAGGTIAARNSNRFYAYLYMTRGATWKICGGALIDAKWVLTAGNCLTGFDKAKIVLGARNRLDTGQSGRVTYEVMSTAFSYHPGFTAGSKVNDAALIELPRDAPLTNVINPVALPLRSTLTTTYVGTVVQICGFGAHDGNAYSENLRTAESTIIANAACRGSYSDLEVTHICATGLTGRGACNGDMGVPITSNSGGSPVLLGVVSFGPVTCGGGPIAPTGGLRVVDMLNWISSKTGKTYP